MSAPVSRKINFLSFDINYSIDGRAPILSFDSIKKGDWLIREMPLYDNGRRYTACRIIEKTAKRITIEARRYDSEYRMSFMTRMQLMVRPLKWWPAVHNGEEKYVAESKKYDERFYWFMTQDELEAAVEPDGGWCD